MPEWHFISSAITENMSNAECERPLVQVPISSIPQTVLQEFAIAFFIAERFAERIVAIEGQATRETFVPLHLQRVIGRIGKIPDEIRICELRIADDQVLRQAAIPQQPTTLACEIWCRVQVI